MSGTSVDGADGCAVRLWWEQTNHHESQLRFDLLAHHQHPIGPTLRKQLLGMMQDEPTPLAALCSLDAMVAQWLSDCANETIAVANLQPNSITGIASHGQTIFHQPPEPTKPPGQAAHAPLGRTLQIGDPSIIAANTGILTVADFRVADMAIGGHGAPLVPFSDGWLFGNTKYGRCIQNIGGMGNVTVLPPNNYALQSNKERGLGWSDIKAFDTGPGNVWIDAAMAYLYGQPYDADGAIAATGELHLELWQTLQHHPYLTQEPPKSTGRETFGGHQLMAMLTPLLETAQSHDVIHTLTHFTAWSIADAYTRFVLPHTSIQQVILGGGGAKNPTLVKMLSEALKVACKKLRCKVPRVMTHDDFDIPNSAKEALAFAILGWANQQGIPNNVPNCTGANHPAILGKTCYPPII